MQMSLESLYLVEGEVETRIYMKEYTERNKYTRLVYAISYAEAQGKFTKHFEMESSPYGTSYSVLWTNVNGVIN